MYNINFFHINRAKKNIFLILIIIIILGCLLLYKEFLLYKNLKRKADSLQKDSYKTKLDEIDILTFKIKNLENKKESYCSIRNVNLEKIYNKLDDLSNTNVIISFLRLENLDMDLEIAGKDKFSLINYKDKLEDNKIGDISFLMLREEAGEYRYRLGVKLYE